MVIEYVCIGQAVLGMGFGVASALYVSWDDKRKREKKALASLEDIRKSYDRTMPFKEMIPLYRRLRQIIPNLRQTSFEATTAKTMKYALEIWLRPRIISEAHGSLERADTEQLERILDDLSGTYEAVFGNDGYS